MYNWQELIVEPNTSIMKAIEVIDRIGKRVALVADHDYRLVGIITDGDLRRSLLKRIPLEATVTEIMHNNPIVAYSDTSVTAILDLMKTKSVFHVPIVDENRKLLGIKFLEDYIGKHFLNNRVILMAGGLGSRLGTLTEDCPKSLLKVAGKPILEIILEKFIQQGFRHFKIAINYKGAMIENYFGNGESLGIHIEYIREEQRLGTAGALSLLQEEIKHPFIVMNADLLTNADFAGLLQFHQANYASATMCVKEYDIQVPYGVVEVEDNKITAIHEKPVHKFFVNAGIYVLNPEVLGFLPRNTYCDMPALFQSFLKNNFVTASFPIREFWMDIGQAEDFKNAEQNFNTYIQEPCLR